jgi:hypothetical protein
VRAKLLVINFDEYSDGEQITGRFKRTICANRYPVISVNLDDSALIKSTFAWPRQGKEEGAATSA